LSSTDPAERTGISAETSALPGYLAGFPERLPGETVVNMNFENFVRAERSKLIWFLMAHGASAEEADDAAQAALIEAWRKWSTITSPRGWVYRVALRQYWRSVPKADADRSVAELPEQASSLSAADEAEITERERAICAELAQLPPQQRLVVVMRYEGYTNREIADQLGVDASAVRHNVLRAKSRLRHLCANPREDAG
jgi:RNA polymerase sigma factor (sigma-70 family)